MNPSLIKILLLAMTVVACRTPSQGEQKSAGGSAHGKGRKESQPPHVLLEVPITYDVTDRAAHSPMVEADIGGARTKLILDSGSTDHVLTIELANRVRLKSEPTEPGTDHAGAAVPSWTLGDVPMRLGDLDSLLHRAVAIKGPAPFEGWGVGGFLSPQNIHPSAYVVMDLAGDRLILLEGDVSPVSEWLDARYPMLRHLSLKREKGPTILVQASIVPFGPVVTIFDTGGRGTEFAKSTVPGLRGKPAESVGHGVSGTEVQGEEASGQTLRVNGEVDFPIPTLLVREKMHAPHGLIGMDLLRGTVLVVSADPEKPVHWLVRPPRSP